MTPWNGCKLLLVQKALQVNPPCAEQATGWTVDKQRGVTDPAIVSVSIQSCQSFFNWREYFTKFLSFKYVLLDTHAQLQWSYKGKTSRGFWIRSPNDVTQWLNWNWIWIGQKLGWPRHSKQALQPLAGGPEAETISITHHGWSYSILLLNLFFYGIYRLNSTN